MKPYTFFNSICLLFIGFFLLATIFVWRRADIHRGIVYDPGVEALSFQEVTKSDEGIKITEEEDVTEELPEELVVEEVIKEVVEIQKEIPASFNLAVPFTSQAPEKNWEQPWQDACEEAAVLMLDAYYKEYGLSALFAKDEMLKMLAWEEERSWGRSIEIEKVQLLSEMYIQGDSGKQAFLIVKNPTVEQIKTSIANGHPVLAVVYGKELPNPHFQHGGPEYHALIIRGYTDKTFITNDPGTQFGENFEYEYAALMDAIHDWNHGEPEKGESVVMMENI
jgi:hypothetical protein